MRSSCNGHHEVVRSLLQAGGDVNTKSTKVRNQMMMKKKMMMMIVIIIELTILMMIMMMMMIVINDENVDDCR